MKRKKKQSKFDMVQIQRQELAHYKSLIKVMGLLDDVMENGLNSDLVKKLEKAVSRVPWLEKESI